MKSAKEILDTVLPENINEYEWLTTGNLREKLEALVLAGMNCDRWISVETEKPPKNENQMGFSDDVLVWVGNYSTISAYNHEDEWWTNLPLNDKLKVTHWQELPKFPKNK